MENKLREYVLERIAELDKLIALQEPDSPHYYALTAGKFEILLLAKKVLGA